MTQTPSPTTCGFQAPPRCGILPPYLLRTLAERTDTPQVAQAAEHTLRVERAMRGEREVRASRPRNGGRPGGVQSFVPGGLRREPHRDLAGVQRPTGTPDRSVHDAQHGSALPGVLRRGEDDPEHADESVNEVYDGLGATWRLFHDEYGRDSLDDAGLPLVASVHFERDYDNAFWDGRQMVFGDGDGQVFASFTDSLDVIGHELAHGFTQYTTGFVYVGQSGALNEHVSDVFGVLTAQHHDRVSAAEADWLVGKGLFTDVVQGVALRSMIEPGTAYDDPQLGTDPQPGSMSDYVVLPHDEEHDNGGVHINSGIPNRAFALAAIAAGGNAWETVGPIWYDVMVRGGLPKDADFDEFAVATLAAAQRRYGSDSREYEGVRGAWQSVGVRGRMGS